MDPNGCTRSSTTDSRLLARVEDGEVRLITRGGLDWTTKFPALAHRVAELPLDSVLIDGELVHLEPEGTTSFSGLQDAISNGKTGALNFFAFDLLYRDGWILTDAALEDRKTALAEIISPQAQGILRYRAITRSAADRRFSVRHAILRWKGSFRNGGRSRTGRGEAAAGSNPNAAIARSS